MEAMEENPDNIRLAIRIKALRTAKKLTLTQLEERSDLGASTISKIERGTISPSYATLLKLSTGLSISLPELIEANLENTPKTRRSITRSHEGLTHSIGSHEYRILCSELTNKKMIPMVATVKARELKELSASSERANGLSSHEGEEVLFVISGEVILHTEFYSPVTLKVGDCAYIDSSMGHVCLKGSEEDATVFWVCTDITLISEDT